MYLYLVISLCVRSSGATAYTATSAKPAETTKGIMTTAVIIDTYVLSLISSLGLAVLKDEIVRKIKAPAITAAST